tara:strand:- start:1965 stop:2576 length:612 start_codon:yes stop_codon:yes gene_type:complete
MKIILNNISKKYNKKYVFKNFSYQFENKYYSITGSNGSGKTTLLKIILGYITPQNGNVTYYKNNSKIEDDNFGFFSFASPYQEIIEEFTLNEIIHFHFKFLSPINKMKENEIINLLEMEEYSNIRISNFSTGMKQKVKLGLALFSECEFTLLDEPCSNLDDNGIIWYHKNVEESLKFKKIIVASNNKNEILNKNVVNINLDKN